MPKLKPVTDEELADVISITQDAQHIAAELTRRLNATGSVSAPTDPLQRAIALLSSATAIRELASQLLLRAALDETRKTTRAELENRK